MKGRISCSLIYGRQAHAMAPFPSNERSERVLGVTGNKVLPGTHEIDLWIFDLRKLGPEARRFDRNHVRRTTSASSSHQGLYQSLPVSTTALP